jgi:hypothetical protein
MPNWYNHSSESDGKSSNKSYKQVTDRQERQATASREMKKNLLKILMITTNQTRMEMAEEIATEFDCNVSVSSIDDLKAEIKEENEFQLQEMAEKEIQKQYMEYSLMKHELWKAWRLSFEDEIKERTEIGETPKGEVNKTITTRRNRLPDVMYMRQIDDINDSIRELLGMKQQLEVNFNQQNNQVNVIGSGAPALVPEDHDVFTKNPKEIEEGSYTSIDEDL